MKSKSKIVSIIVIFIILLFANISMAADTATITVETARLRESPSQDSSILELISLNEEVEVLSQEGEWYQVKYNGITGYLRNDLLKVDNKDNNSANTGTNEGSTGDNQNTENTTETNNQESGQNTTDQTVNQATQDTVNTTDIDNTTTDETVNDSVQENVKQEETDITGKYIVSTDTNLKILPLINALNVGTLQANSEVEIMELVNEWAFIRNDTIQGWARYTSLTKKEEVQGESQEQPDNGKQEVEEQDAETTEQATQTTQTKYVNANTVNVRKEASTSAEIVAQITVNTEVEVLSEESGWYKVKVNGVEGYIATTLLSDTKQETSRGATEFRTDSNGQNDESTESAQSTENEEVKAEEKDDSQSSNTSSNIPTSGSTSTGVAVLEYAMQYKGYPYIYGGSSPNGFDCSGFTQYVYKHFGVTLSRTAAGQTSNGTAVKRSELQVGDLVMFCTPINHVGIYAGNNQIIHAANKTRGVVIDTISSGYYNTNYNCARRIF